MQCSAAAVWGAGGVTAVQLPRHSLREEVVVAGLALVSGGGAVQAVVWHPGSAADSHRAVLTRDAKIVLYNVMFGLGEVRGLALGRTGRNGRGHGFRAGRRHCSVLITPADHWQCYCRHCTAF